MQTKRQKTFRQVKVSRVFEEICEQIRQQLGSGVLKPGDKLPSERDLAIEFDVGRPAVREALRTLEISGIVSLHKGAKGGAFIWDGDPTILTRSLQDLMLLGRISVRNLVEARVLISGLVIELACERATDDDFQDMEESISHINSLDDIEDRMIAAMTFFQLIARATRNEVLILLVDALGDIIHALTEKMGRVVRPELAPVRRQILKAMRSRNVRSAISFMNQYMAIAHEGIDLSTTTAKHSSATGVVKRLAFKPMDASKEKRVRKAPRAAGD